MDTIGFLAANPNAGPRREELSPGIRSFPVDGYRAYLVFYQPLKDGVVVARLVHGSRDVGAMFGKS
jgi:toxin ParE1/3/4